MLPVIRWLTGHEFAGDGFAFAYANPVRTRSIFVPYLPFQFAKTPSTLSPGFTRAGTPLKRNATGSWMLLALATATVAASATQLLGRTWIVTRLSTGLPMKMRHWVVVGEPRPLAETLQAIRRKPQRRKRERRFRSPSSASSLFSPTDFTENRSARAWRRPLSTLD